MAELKLRKPKYSPWRFNPKTGKYLRVSEAAVLVNFEGHGGQDTLAKLIKNLEKLDPTGNT